MARHDLVTMTRLPILEAADMDLDGKEELYPLKTDPSFTEARALGILSIFPAEIRRKIWGYALYEAGGLNIGCPSAEDNDDSGARLSALQWALNLRTHASDHDAYQQVRSVQEQHSAYLASIYVAEKVELSPLLQHNLLLANKCIYNEALPMLFEVNTVVLRESTSKEVKSTGWFRRWLDKRPGLYNSVRSIDFQEYHVTKEIHKGEETDPDMELMNTCTNLRHVTVHLGHYHYSKPRFTTIEEETKRWGRVYSSFDRASTKWQGRGPEVARAYVQRETQRMTQTYKLNILGEKRTLRSLKIIPSAIYYHEAKGKMSDFFGLVNNELAQSFKGWLGEHTVITFAPCRASVSCNNWHDTIDALN